MHAKLPRASLLLIIGLVFALLLPSAWAGVPNKDAKPAYAEEQTMLQIEGDSVVREPGLANASSGRVHMDRHFLGQYGATEANGFTWCDSEMWLAHPGTVGAPFGGSCRR